MINSGPCTLGIQSQVFGPIWTLKHIRILDLPQQQLQEVLPAKEVARKHSWPVAFEAEQKDKTISKAARLCRQRAEEDEFT